MQTLEKLHLARYALLRSYRRDGTPVDTPIWFALDGLLLVFRTKVGPKTRRLAANPAVELTPCDYKGRVREDAATVAGRATILSVSRRRPPTARCTSATAGSGTPSR